MHKNWKDGPAYVIVEKEIYVKLVQFCNVLQRNEYVFANGANEGKTSSEINKLLQGAWKKMGKRSKFITASECRKVTETQVCTCNC